MKILKQVARFSNKIKEEFLKNPEFDKIYPQALKNKQPSTIHKKDVEVSYMDALTRYRLNKIEDPNYAEAAYHNFKTFVEGFQTPRGPLKELTEDQKKQINIIINQKLQELEDTGLSREELLTSGKNKGVKLTEDAFFQYIKNNEKARYIYLSPNEEFTPQKIIDLALRQDLGKDQITGVQKPFKNDMKLRKNITESDTFINTRDPLQNVNELIKDEVIYHPKFMDSKKKMRFFARRVNNYDIHWRNTEFLAQFLNQSGKIKGRHHTLLSKVQQRKIANAIKTTRHMMLIPHTAQLQAHHKKSLTTLQQDIDEYARRKINIVTGAVYGESQLQRMERSVESLALLEDYEMQYGNKRPEGDSLELVKAQLYADKLKEEELLKQGIEKKVDVTHNFQIMNNQIDFKGIRDEDVFKQELQQNVEKQQIKESFDKVKDDTKYLSAIHLTEAIICENALNYERIKEISKIKEKKMSLEESLSFINQIRRKGGLKELQV